MKKNLFISLVFLTALTACTSCEGPAGPAGRDGVANWSVQYYVVGQHSAKYPYGYWESLGNGHYQCIFDIRELTDFVYNEGIVNVSLIEYYGTPDEIQVGLPHVFFNQDPAGRYTTSYSFDTTPGSVALNVSYSDFQNVPPPVCFFKVTLLW
jgi:hypothetical protein